MKTERISSGINQPLVLLKQLGLDRTVASTTLGNDLWRKLLNLFQHFWVEINAIEILKKGADPLLVTLNHAWRWWLRYMEDNETFQQQSDILQKLKSLNFETKIEDYNYILQKFYK
eukprot:178689_1